MTLQRGTPEMAEWLMLQWMDRDHPCSVAAGEVMARGDRVLEALGRLSETGFACQFCGQEFEKVAGGWRHPR